ncbi:MAG: iron-regulated protein [Bacteroidetes bacterium]|nr:MAG: iron-regulated protein [Bacteroidota bacterium]
MKIRFILAILVGLFISLAGRADKPAYRIFDAKGKKASYKELLKDAGASQVVFFGELHDNPISHWLEVELTKDLFEIRQEKLVLAAEMFERDNQLLLDEYTRNFIRKKDFEKEAKLWPNYSTDYAPLVDFAREHNIKFIASNIPRRYAAIVNYQGFAGLDSINAYQRGMIAPLPIKYDSTLSCYKSMKEMFTGEGAMHQTMNLAEAQAIKDATMGYFICKNVQEEGTLLHFNGAYHSDNFEGTVWYLKDYARKFSFDIRVMTITCVEQDDIENLSEENLGKADFIICIPGSMTKTY